MSEFTYTYSRSGDFTNGLAPGQFATEVSGSSIGTNFLRVDTLGDAVDVVFSVALSGAEQVTLDGLVAAHVPDPVNFITTTNGYIELDSTLADAQSIRLTASDVAGGIYINAGTGGIDVDTTNAFTLDAGAAISIANTAGNITLDTPALIDLNAQSGINIGNDADAAPINIGTSASSRTITAGNSTGTTALNLTSGTGNTSLTSQGTVTIDSVGLFTVDAGGVLELNSDGGGISIGNDANNHNINLGTAGSRVITIGNTNAASAVNIISGTWGLTIGNDASSGEIQIAASANAKTVVIGNTTGGSRICERWGSGGHIKHQSAETALSNGNATLTIAQILGELFTIDPSTARTLTLPTAADAVAGVSGVQVDDCVDFRIINLGTAMNDPEIVIAMGTGGTMVGNEEVYPHINNTGTYNYSGTGVFRMRFTNVTASSEAYTVYRIA